MAAAAFSYRSQDNSDSDSENSDTEREHWKRATGRSKDENLEKIAIPPPVLPTPDQKVDPPKRKRNNIWCEVLEDQMMSETLDDCLLKNKPKGYGSRGEESYDYTLSFKHHKKNNDYDDKMSDDNMSDPSEVNCATSFRSKKFQNSNKFVKLDADGVKTAKKIVQTLGEKKHYLIFRVVKFIGIKKAMQLLKETEEIEENGGMMIKNQQRRRTPGGVYFQLLKADKDVTKAAVDKIFEGEFNSYELRKKADVRRNKKKLDAEKKKLLERFNEQFGGKLKQSEPEKDTNLEVMEGDIEEPSVQNVDAPNTEGADLEDGELDD